jgi:hypothetical protein
MLLNAYPGTRSLGIVRACSIGGLSEHKEGRAFDWGGLSASRATDRARVNSLMTWLFATDRHGNRYAMARRLGVQYIVWNKRIWGAYAAGSGWRAYNGSNPHTDHVHFSLSWAGANKTTSYWTGRVTNPPPPPRPTGPAPLPPRITTPPTRPGSLPTGPAITDETVVYPAKTPGVTTRGALVRGERYLLEVSGSYSWAKVRVLMPTPSAPRHPATARGDAAARCIPGCPTPTTSTSTSMARTSARIPTSTPATGATQRHIPTGRSSSRTAPGA